jgi:hypothetical protein
VNRWLKREFLIAGRQRVLASVILFWGPILLMVLLLLAIRLALAVGFLTPN